MFVQTVRQNYEGFAKKEIEKALLDREALGLIGNPSERDLKYLVNSNLDDCPVIIPDVENSRKIFDPILGGVHGKTPDKIRSMRLRTMLLFPRILWYCTSM